MVSNYKEWVVSIQKEHKDLEHYRLYLNEAGLAKFEAVTELYHLTDFCDNAKELVAMIDDALKTSVALNHYEATSPIRRLRMIAETE